MKKILLSAFVLATCFNASSQCNELIISEYVEGTSNNKALEIFNPTQNAINLNSEYRIVRYNNGSSAAAGEANNQAWINLGNHTIAAQDAWVIVIDQRDPNGSGQTAPIDAALEAVADTFLCPDYNVNYAMYFNGNDAVSLQKYVGGNWVYVDLFGKMGDASMTTSLGWSDAFPYDGSAGEIWTKDHTLRRKAIVMAGVTANPSTFIVTTEWDSTLVNTFSGLGTHTCNCPGVGVNEIENQISVTLFPNPSGTGTATISAAERINSVEVFNMMGQQVLNSTNANQNNLIQVNTSNLPAGTYMVKVYFPENKFSFIKLSVQ